LHSQKTIKEQTVTRPFVHNILLNGNRQGSKNEKYD